MPLIVVSAGTPIIPPGVYNATLVAIREKSMVTSFSNGKEADFLEWVWSVEGEERDVEITSLTSRSFAPKSKVVSEYLPALLGLDAVEVGAGFDEGDLVGKRVQVKIADKDGFAKVEGIFPPLRQRAAAPAAAPVVAPAPAPEADLSDLPF